MSDGNIETGCQGMWAESVIPEHWSYAQDLPAFLLGWVFVGMWIAGPSPPSLNIFLSLAVFVIVFTNGMGLAIWRGWWK